MTYFWLNIPIGIGRLLVRIQSLLLIFINNENNAGRINVTDEFRTFCDVKQINFKMDTSVKSYDDTTLFCPAGMQQFKSLFKDPTYTGTTSNIQSCLRLNDIDEIGDGSHLLYFNMIGLFSFRDWDVSKAINFWMEFLDRIGIQPDYITIHPDKPEWVEFYKSYNVEIRFDKECEWSDGEIGGYCTEFFKDGIEIGNIVNPLGTCIDVGFGLERLEMILNKLGKSKEQTLNDTVIKIIESGFKPSHYGEGYVLKKLLRMSYKQGVVIDHQYYHDEILRQEKILKNYNRLKRRNSDKSKEWWWNTHGIDLDLL